MQGAELCVIGRPLEVSVERLLAEPEERVRSRDGIAEQTATLYEQVNR